MNRGTYVVRPLNEVQWTMSRDLWATWDRRKLRVIDVYDSRELADAWVKYMNERTA